MKKHIALLVLLIMILNFKLKAQIDSNKDNAVKAYHFKQDGNIQFSAGYGFPSLLRFVTKLELMLQVYETKGIGPIHAKLEYVHKRRFTAGASIFYNSFYTKFKRGFDTLHYVMKDISVQGRVNYFIKNNDKQQLYIGAGLGSVNFNNKTYSVVTTNNVPDTLLSTSLIKDFDRTTLEAGIGYRYWLRPNFGLYSEIGIGRTILTFLDKGAADSFIQFGISGRIFDRRRK